MIYRAAPPQNLTEGRPSVSMSVRGPSFNVPEMPPQFTLDPAMVKQRRTILEHATTFDRSHSSQLLQVRKDIPHIPHTPHHIGGDKISNLQPYTAPWLTEVARMTPVRPLAPHLPLHCPDFFSRIQGGLRARAPMYNPTFLPHQSYLREYVHSPHNLYKGGGLHPHDLIRDSMPSSTSITPTCLGPIAHPQPLSSKTGMITRNIHDLRVPLDFRDGRSSNHSYRSIISDSTPTESEESSPKRRLIRFSESYPSTGISESKTTTAYTEQTLTTQSKSSPRAITKKLPSSEIRVGFTDQDSQIRSHSPYHPHFQKGSFVSLPYGIQKVEDMQTKDFLEATDASTTLKLDPSKVEEIEPKSGENVSMITFSFASTNTKIDVEASNSHPFFVFHRGWSSCCPQQTEDKYGLKTYQLCSGDVCISLKKIEPVEEVNTTMPPPKLPIKSSVAPTTKPEIVPLLTTSPDITEAVSTKDKIDLTFRPNFPLSSTRPGVKSSVDEPTNQKSRGRKRRWSDPGH